MSLRGTLKNEKNVALWKFDAAIGSPASATDEVSAIVLASPSAGASPVQVTTNTGNGLNFNLTTQTLNMATGAVAALQNLASGDWTVMAFYTTNNNTSEWETIASIHSPAGGNELLGVYVDPGFDHVRVQWNDSGNTLRTCDLAFVIDANVPHHYAVRCKKVDATHFNLSLVVDGVEVATGTNNFNHCAVSDQILTVSDGSAAGVDSVLKGIFDELALFNSYLSVYEIAVNAAGNPTPSASSDPSFTIQSAWALDPANKLLAVKFSQQPYSSEAYNAASYTVTGRTVLSVSGYDPDPTVVVLTLDALDPLNLPLEVTVAANIGNFANTYSTPIGNKVKVRDVRTYLQNPPARLADYGTTSHDPVPFYSPGVLSAGATSNLYPMTSATALDGKTVRIVFGTSVKHVSASNSDDALNPANYLFSGGLVAASVAHVSGGTTFDITLVNEQLQDQTYTVKIVGVKDAGGTRLPDPASTLSFAAVANLPTFSNVACGDGHVDVTFSKPVDENTITLTAFAISTVTGGIVPLSIVGVKQLAADQYRFHTNTRATNAATYRITHAGGVKDQIGNSMAGGLNVTFTGVSTLPSFTANVLSATSILVTFDRTMSDDAELVNPANYLVDHNTKVVSVTKVSTSAVLLTTTPMTPGVTYNVSVN